MYYKLNCEDGTYVMTSNLKNRLEHHRYGSKDDSNRPSYEIMVITQTKELALHFEDIAIRKYGTLNKQFSGGKSDTSEYIRAYQRTYREAHRDNIRAYMRAYFRALQEGEKMMFGRTYCRLYHRMFEEGRNGS